MSRSTSSSSSGSLLARVSVAFGLAREHGGIGLALIETHSSYSPPSLGHHSSPALASPSVAPLLRHLLATTIQHPSRLRPAVLVSVDGLWEQLSPASAWAALSPAQRPVFVDAHSDALGWLTAASATPATSSSCTTLSFSFTKPDPLNALFDRIIEAHTLLSSNPTPSSSSVPTGSATTSSATIPLTPVFIDSLSSLVMRCGLVATNRLLHRLQSTGLLALVCLVDEPILAAWVLRSSSPTVSPLATLESQATTIIAVHPPSTVAPPRSVCCLLIKHKRLSGKLALALEDCAIQQDSTMRGVQVPAIVGQQQSVAAKAQVQAQTQVKIQPDDDPDDQDARTSAAGATAARRHIKLDPASNKADPAAGASFNLRLTDKQRAVRSANPPPYVHQGDAVRGNDLASIIQSITSGAVGGSSVPSRRDDDDDDDEDDDDPDADLEI